MERLSHNHTDNSDELLSAYIDNAVDAGERRRAEQLIAACAACAQEVQELRMFRALLRDLPNVQPRRSFTLDPATVAPQRRLLFPTLRWSSLVAALLFVVVLGVDVLGAPGSAMPASAPAAESAAKGDPATQHFDSSGGAADTMMVPQASPAASVGADQANVEASSSPLTAELPPTTIAASPAASAASAAVPEAAPAAGAYPPQEEAPAAAAASEEPEMARNAQTPVALSDPAGGNAGQLPQTGFRANEPAGANTTDLVQDATAQSSWWSSYALRIAEVALALIALLLGGAALWARRRQL